MQLNIAVREMPLDLKITVSAGNNLWAGCILSASALEHLQRKVRGIEPDGPSSITIPTAFKGNQIIQLVQCRFMPAVFRPLNHSTSQHKSSVQAEIEHGTGAIEVVISVHLILPQWLCATSVVNSAKASTIKSRPSFK